MSTSTQFMINKAGVPVEAEDRYGRTPMDYAIKNQQNDVMEFLRKSIKIPSRNHSVSSPPLSGPLLEDVRKKAEALEIHSEEEEEEENSVDPTIQENQENSTEIENTHQQAINSLNINACVRSQSPVLTSSDSESTDSPLIPTERPYEYLDPFLENKTEKYCSEDLSLTEDTTITVDGESTSDDSEELGQISVDRDEQYEKQDDSSGSSSNENKEENDTNSDAFDQEKAEYEDLPVSSKIVSTLEDIPSFVNSDDEYLEDFVEKELEHLIESSGEEDLVPRSDFYAESPTRRSEPSSLLDTSGEHQGVLVNEPDHVHIFFRITYFDSKF
ncbi:unnamed protein product [Oikopleura dioica]|uniref:Uncharacterized protein n=1 Tax=Oikopleura dioica TaxID=34765 RepID=E4X5S3_OIKDI|nr:unnamed protein product [Oikopleura dioica]